MLASAMLHLNVKQTCASGGKENVPNGASEGIGEGDEEEEYVEQEGCPDEEDFNRWSHHTSVNTCDDEALQRAMGDDNTVLSLLVCRRRSE